MVLIKKFHFFILCFLDQIGPLKVLHDAPDRKLAF